MSFGADGHSPRRALIMAPSTPHRGACCTTAPNAPKGQRQEGTPRHAAADHEATPVSNYRKAGLASAR